MTDTADIKEITIELCGNFKCYLLFTGTFKKYFLSNVMVFPMGEQISLIRSHIRHGQDGVRVDTPGASFGGLGLDCQC